MTARNGPMTRDLNRRQAETLQNLRAACVRHGFPPEYAEDRAEHALREAVAEYIALFGRHSLMPVVVDAADEAQALEARQ